MIISYEVYFDNWRNYDYLWFIYDFLHCIENFLWARSSQFGPSRFGPLGKMKKSYLNDFRVVFFALPANKLVAKYQAKLIVPSWAGRAFSQMGPNYFWMSYQLLPLSHFNCPVLLFYTSYLFKIWDNWSVTEGVINLKLLSGLDRFSPSRALYRPTHARPNCSEGLGWWAFSWK